MDDLFRPRDIYSIGKNARLKKYPSGKTDLLVCDTPIFGLDGWEARRKKSRSPKSGDFSVADRARSMGRARSKLRDYALCTPFTHFVTLTLDRQKIDRYDIDSIIKRMRVWLDNRVRRNGLIYLLVPELHKDGAVHFHGFFNAALPLSDSGLTDSGNHRIYNLPSWDFGFTTAIELYGDYEAAVGYVCKYIGKSADKVGGRWYYSGGKLCLPDVEYINVDDSTLFDDSIPVGSRFDVPEAGLRFVSIRD